MRIEAPKSETSSWMIGPRGNSFQRLVTSQYWVQTVCMATPYKLITLLFELASQRWILIPQGHLDFLSLLSQLYYLNKLPCDTKMLFNASFLVFILLHIHLNWFRWLPFESRLHISKGNSGNMKRVAHWSALQGQWATLFIFFSTGVDVCKEIGGGFPMPFGYNSWPIPRFSSGGNCSQRQS